MAGYVDAYYKDLKRLCDELKKLNDTLKRSPNDAKAKAAKDKMAPFLTEKALKQRFDHATKLDFADQGKTVSNLGLPGW